MSAMRELLENARQKILRSLTQTRSVDVTENVESGEKPEEKEEDYPGWEPSVELEDAPPPE